MLQEEALLEELKKRKDYYIEEGVKLRSSTIEPHLIHNNSLALEVLDDDIEVQKREVSVARKNVDAARQRMMDARAQTRIYEKLKEDDFAEFVSEQGKAEGKEIDELNSFRFSGKQILLKIEKTEKKADANRKDSYDLLIIMMIQQKTAHFHSLKKLKMKA